MFPAIAIDWSQPPVACVEEVTPSVPERGCLDLAGVNDPLNDWPLLSSEDRMYWVTHKAQLTFCRSHEVMRRENLNPGTFSRGTVEIAWMHDIAVDNAAEKVTAIYDASREYKIPAQVLTGALMQESLFADLGIAEDGGNYSCGIGQLNIVEWCRWASEQSEAVHLELGLPSAFSCNLIDTDLVKPFYDIAVTRLGDLPEYRLRASHFNNIEYADVADDFPAASADVQKLRYQIVNAFVHTCSVPKYGIAAKGHELAHLYETYVPEGLKTHDYYKLGEGYKRSCQRSDESGAYPLNTGYMLAVGMYNAGPQILDAIAHYQGWKREDLQKEETFAAISPPDLVESLYWAGRFDSLSDKMIFTNLEGALSSLSWYRLCVVQRHIARVAQHVTIAGAPAILQSLEGNFPCALPKRDAETGEITRSGVPPARQVSSGEKDK